MSEKRSTRGFTIVELLIVIVVIAILAAISVVAYNGIQQRATYARQIAELDKIGKAIQLWSAENGTSLKDSNTGYQRQGTGGFMGTTVHNSVYGDISVSQLLRDAGYLSGNFTTFSEGNVLLSACTTLDNSRWVVMALVNPAPQKSVSQQIADTGCTHSTINLYTDPNLGYARNLIKAY